MIKKLTTEETIAAGHGEYWIRDWEDKASGGEKYADTNLPLLCYELNGKIYSLNVTRETTRVYQKYEWEVSKASDELRESVLEEAKRYNM